MLIITVEGNLAPDVFNTNFRSMSSFAKAQKNMGRGLHRERSQPEERRHLGRLQKKVDYKKRSADFHKKVDRLRRLKQHAANKNPDEFYHKMISTKLRDGVHVNDQTVDTSTPEQDLIEKSQSHSYVVSKLTSESRKIDRLKNQLQFLDNDLTSGSLRPLSKHIVFVEDNEAVEEFEATSYFNTAERLIGRSFNRPKLDQLKSLVFDQASTTSVSQKMKSYRELEGRISRKKKLAVMESKMQQKKNLCDKYNRPIAKLAPETVNSAAVYKWSYKRRK